LPDDCRSHEDLQRLSNEELIKYLLEQRDAGRPQCAKHALEVLAFGYWQQVQYRVRRKVPAPDVEDVAAGVIESAISSTFDGRAIGQFVSWLNTITHYRIADYHRSRERRPRPEPLPEEHEGEEEIWGAIGAEDGRLEAVLAREGAARVLSRRSAVHQDVIRLYGPNELNFVALAAAEAAARIEATHPGEAMSEANVHQIWRRFKTDLQDELGLPGS
jgi:DNA-directed RNA polymerase specialized sigma24 family protein